MEGSEQVGGDVAPLADPDGETREFFYIEFSSPQKTWKTWQKGALGHETSMSGDDIGFVTDTATTAGDQIELRVGLSYISTDQARRNLEREIPKWGFDAVKERARAVWNNALGAVAVAGGTERQRTVFYTALYRSLNRMTDTTEDGRYFSGYDHQVHSSEGHDFYVDDGLWDTFRSLHPLQTLLDSHRQQDMARSYIRMYQQSGWMPSFPSVAGEQAVMIGHHAAKFILDLYEKGYRDFDVEQAYEGIVRMRPRPRCSRGAALR